MEKYNYKSAVKRDIWKYLQEHKNDYDFTEDEFWYNKLKNDLLNERSVTGGVELKYLDDEQKARHLLLADGYDDFYSMCYDNGSDIPEVTSYHSFIECDSLLRQYLLHYVLHEMFM